MSRASLRVRFETVRRLLARFQLTSTSQHAGAETGSVLERVPSMPLEGLTTEVLIAGVLERGCEAEPERLSPLGLFLRRVLLVP